jgi:hypothetical protein
VITALLVLMLEPRGAADASGYAILIWIIVPPGQLHRRIGSVAPEARSAEPAPTSAVQGEGNRHAVFRLEQPGTDKRIAARSVLDCEPSFKIRKLSHLALEPAVFIALSDAWREIGLPE